MGISVAVILLNYYSVSLSEYTSSTAFGSLVALYVLTVVLAFSHPLPDQERPPGLRGVPGAAGGGWR